MYSLPFYYLQDTIFKFKNCSLPFLTLPCEVLLFVCFRLTFFVSFRATLSLCLSSFCPVKEDGNEQSFLLSSSPYQPIVERPSVKVCAFCILKTCEVFSESSFFADGRSSTRVGSDIEIQRSFYFYYGFDTISQRRLVDL